MAFKKIKLNREGATRLGKKARDMWNENWDIIEGAVGKLDDYLNDFFAKVEQTLADFKAWMLAKFKEQDKRIDNLTINTDGTNIAEVVDARQALDGSIQTTLRNRLIYDLSKRLDTAQLINFLAGEDIEITDTFDFRGKIAGSNSENPHSFYFGGNEWTSLMLPTASWGVGSQNHYRWIEKLDGTVVTASRTTANVIAQGRTAFNLLEGYKRQYPNLFRSENSDETNLNLLKNKLSQIEPILYVKGSNFAGNKISAGPYSNTESTWWLMGSSSSGEIAKISSTYSTSAQLSFLLNAQGIVNINYYADAATETTPSVAVLDYACIKGTIKINIKDIAIHEELTTIHHEFYGYPGVRVMASSYALGTVPLGEEPMGFGGSNVISIESSIDYLDRYHLVVKVPNEYRMSAPVITKLSSTSYLLVEGINSLRIELQP